MELSEISNWIGVNTTRAVAERIANLEAEIEKLREKEIKDDVRWMRIVYFVEKLRMNCVEGGMIAGWLDELDALLADTQETE